jgi:hypothetical protein
MGCFDDLENESIEACVNQELQAGVSEVNVHYAFHEHTTAIPMPLNIGDVDFDYESAVTVTEDITFPIGKGFSKISIMSDTGEVMFEAVGNKGNKKNKSSFAFAVPGNAKKTLGFLRTCKNIPMIWCVGERDGQKRLIGDSNNPAYVTEGKATTGKGGEDDKLVNFTIEAYSLPIVYEGALTMNVAPV